MNLESFVIKQYLFLIINRTEKYSFSHLVSGTLKRIRNAINIFGKTPVILFSTIYFYTFTGYLYIFYFSLVGPLL